MSSDLHLLCEDASTANRTRGFRKIGADAISSSDITVLGQWFGRPGKSSPRSALRLPDEPGQPQAFAASSASDVVTSKSVMLHGVPSSIFQ
jgi:hypothetical protein